MVVLKIFTLRQQLHLGEKARLMKASCRSVKEEKLHAILVPVGDFC